MKYKQEEKELHFGKEKTSLCSETQGLKLEPVIGMTLKLILEKLFGTADNLQVLLSVVGFNNCSREKYKTRFWV